MSGDRPPSSFGDPSAQPPTPRQTPVSGVFPSPVFETPHGRQGSFSESGGYTPRFAEEYSVFNSTPGNFSASQGPFVDFVPPTPNSISPGHKRFLSSESFAAEIAAHATHFSPDPNTALPPVDPSIRLGSFTSPEISGRSAGAPVTLTSPIQKTRSSKKPRRGTITETAQVLTPPPTARKGERKLAPKPTMQNDQNFPQPDFSASSQEQEIMAMMAHPSDMFSFPMSAPVTESPSFWDTSASMGMEFSFAAADQEMFPALAPSHRQSGSFDWGHDASAFPEPQAPPPSSNQENVQPTRRQRAIAPKPTPTFADQGIQSATPGMAQATFQPTMSNPLGVVSPGIGVDPGLLFTRPQTSGLAPGFQPAVAPAAADMAMADASASNTATTQSRRASSSRGGKLPERAEASSPIKPSSRPGLSRSYSENRGTRTGGRGKLPTPAPSQPASGPERPRGRTSPMKHQHRLSSLASIPETAFQRHQQPAVNVKFTIDANGRARAEMANGSAPGPFNMSHRRHSLASLGRERDEQPDDGSGTDDEPIIIPSRNTSFNASYALEDPVKPIGSIFHSSTRSISDKSDGTAVTADGSGPSGNDPESEAETLMNEQQGTGGNALSELRRVKHDRHKRSSHAEDVYQQASHHGEAAGFHRRRPSPTKLSSRRLSQGQAIRCVCHKNGADMVDGFMVQCKSCEMWLHGKCIRVTQMTVPAMYICRFCTNTPNSRTAGRARDSDSSGLSMGTASSPLASKSFQSFR